MYSVFKLGVHVLFSIASSTINETNFNPDIIDTPPPLDKNEIFRAPNCTSYLDMSKYLTN